MIKQTVVLLRKFEENMDQSQTHLAVTLKVHDRVVFSDHYLAVVWFGSRIR